MAADEFTIRQAESNDVARIQACAREAYAPYVPRMGRDPAPMIADFTSQVASGIVHVGEDGPSFIGFVVFYPRDNHMHLENVAVAAGAQGCGHGGRLIDFVEQQARKQELDSVELYTNEKMTENVPYYLARGYVEVGRWKEDGFDRIFFRKEV